MVFSESILNMYPMILKRVGLSKCIIAKTNDKLLPCYGVKALLTVGWRNNNSIRDLHIFIPWSGPPKLETVEQFKLEKTPSTCPDGSVPKAISDSIFSNYWERVLNIRTIKCGGRSISHSFG